MGWNYKDLRFKNLAPDKTYELADNNWLIRLLNRIPSRVDLGITEALGGGRTAGQVRGATTAIDNTPADSTTPDNGGSFTQEDFDNAVKNQVAAILSGGGGGGETYQPEMVQATPGGNYYDLNDPVQREAYFNERQQYAMTRIGEYETDQRSTLNMLIDQARRDAETYRGQYDTAQKQDDTAWKQYLDDFAYGMQDLDTKYGQGEAARAGKYTALSPNAYQSSMGTSGQYALGKLQEGKKRKERQKETEQAQKTLREMQRQADIKSLNDYYDSYEKQQRSEFDRAVEEFKQTLLGEAMKESSAFSTADAKKGVFSGSKYNYNQLADWKPTQADTSDLIPDISFSTSGTPKASGTNLLTQAAQTAATPIKTQSMAPLDTYQGMTPNSKEKDPLQAWLY